ncbi:peptidylprolyl isomerase [soil metagenome]|nr:peptidylprolyl isomerase [Acidimicrobiia bacterium]
MLLTSTKKWLGPALAASLALASCSSVTDTRAATVNGDVISAGDLEDELLAIRGNEGYRSAVERSLAEQGLGVTGEGEGSFDTAFAARLLSLGVFFEIIDQEARTRGISVSAADVEDARPSTVASVGGEDVFTAFPEDYQQELIRRQALAANIQEAVAPSPGVEEARAYYEQNRATFAGVCVSHIFASAERGPDDARARINDLAAQLAQGADFRVLATEQSDDTAAAAQGGSLGCQARGNLVPAFEEAAYALPIGQISEPVETDFGFHLILVEDRRELPFEEVQEEVLATLDAERVPVFAAFVNDVTCQAEVDVNPRYGSWTGACEDPQQEGRVLPPEGPAEAPSAPEFPGSPGGGAVRPGGG